MFVPEITPFHWPNVITIWFYLGSFFRLSGFNDTLLNGRKNISLPIRFLELFLMDVS